MLVPYFLLLCLLLLVHKNIQRLILNGARSLLALLEMKGEKNPSFFLLIEVGEIHFLTPLGNFPIPRVGYILFHADYRSKMIIK